MSKIDGKFMAAAETSVELQELLAALGGSAGTLADRHDALAQYLSGDEGWRDARAALRGAFAAPYTDATGLTGDKDR